ncbi:hypothetical protein M9Y10_031517 [Tritrichomonas musculus]|uniref:Uncharacterized protein n=1 Tax=Tritrichomonas musculus TaxID=1915356 RepID=A0ABR2H0V1_9EUKA
MFHGSTNALLSNNPSTVSNPTYNKEDPFNQGRQNVEISKSKSENINFTNTTSQRIGLTVTKPIKTQKVEISKNKQSDEEKIVIQQAKVELTSSKTQKFEISAPKTQKVEISKNKQSDEEKIVNRQTKVELPSENAQKVELTVNKPPIIIHQYKKEEVPEIDRNQVLDSSAFNANEKIEVIEIIKDEKVLKSTNH